MPPLDLGLWKWLLPSIGLVLAIVIIWHGRRTAASQEKHKLEDIKSDLVTMNACERGIAIRKGKQPCSEETAGQIYDDFIALFSPDTINSIIQRVISNRDIEPLIEFFKQFGEILDSNGYGLKVDLENDEVYKSSRISLAQKKLKLKMRKKKRNITQENIHRVSLLTYGLNSSILLRHILNSVPETKRSVPTNLRITLESIETTTEKVLPRLLNDLDKEW